MLDSASDYSKITLEAEEKEKNEVTKVENKPFTPEDVEKALNAFAEARAKQGKNSLKSIFTLVKPSFEKGIIKIEANKQHCTQIEALKIELLQYIRKIIQNSDVVLELNEVQNEVKGKRAYTNREKFEEMAKSNPSILALRDSLGFEVE